MAIRRLWRVVLAGLVAIAVVGGASAPARAQGLGGAGTVQGTVKDPTGGVMVAVTVDISNPVSGFKRSTTTDKAGKFAFRNLPPNNYHVAVTAQGFENLERDVDVRSAVPIELDLSLKLAGATSSVQVVGHAEALVERDPTAHTDIDQSLIDKLPLETSGGLNQVVMMASPGVVADSNSFFHPVGDHAQTQFSIDNQPVTDQQSRIYSNQISSDAVQDMEVITGVAPAEYGDKTSLIVHIVTKSGLDQSKPTGSVSFGYGSFSSPTGEANLGIGSHTFGNFVSVSGLSTDRFLDPPEFESLNNHGTSFSFFDRLDSHPTDVDSFHFNVHIGRSSFDAPNTYDTINANQHQTIDTYNIAPGYTRIIGSNVLLTANGYVRHDHLVYTPSSNPFNDLPATVSQDRTLTNYGAKVDLAYSSGMNNVKFGGTIAATALHERFTFGITNPSDPSFADENGNFNQDLAIYDLTNGGSPFVYDASKTIKSQALYVQDDIRAANATFKLGLRFDHYDGLTSASQLQPRLGVSYAIPQSNTVLRASYGMTQESPYNENLLLSAGYNTDSPLVGTGNPPPPGKRNQMEVGVQQAFGSWVVADVGYFDKRTDNGYDFSVLYNTPIVFPVAWDHSHINGFAGRVNLVEHGGFSAFVVFAHTNAIFSPPGVGGVLLEAAPGDFRIDHDQKFNSTTNLQYVFEKSTGLWAALSWRYDSGLVAGEVPDFATAMTLTADQQTAIGLFCGSTFATLTSPITSCSAANFGATRLVIPGTPANPAAEDDVANPPRIAPRNLFDLGIGADNLFHGSKTKVRVRFSVINLANNEALYNFLSTFSGTHFVTPRAYQVQVGVTF